MSQQHPERPRTFVPPPVPPRPSSRFLQYLLGLGIGAIPLALALLAMGSLLGTYAGTLFAWALPLYGLLFIATIICLVDHRSRFVGYGMLTMVLITPIVYYIACMATFRYCYRTC